MQKWLTLFIVVSSLALTGCPKKQEVVDNGGAGAGSGGVSDTTMPTSGAKDSDSGNAMGLQTIHFPYDSFDIVGENKDILKANVKILKDNPTLNIQIEGHCDERGGSQYNLALSEKRANAVKKAITAGGVGGSRITTLPMGKEHPLVQGSGEDAWAKNRRANFVITSQ
jgi:peptidoglycan-associated lipoprotein